MEKGEISDCKFDSGFNTLICEEDEEHLPYLYSNQGKKQVSSYSMTPWRHYRLATVSLTLLAVVLLIVDICLGVHYTNLKDTHLTLDDTEHISDELTKLQDTYKDAIESMHRYKIQLSSERGLQHQTEWELEHQNRRQTDYEERIGKMTQEVTSLRRHVPMIQNGCKHCPVGWILMGTVCFYFPFSDAAGYKTWQKAREFCQMQGGDLAVIDNKDKENSTVRYLNSNLTPRSKIGFWIGLKDSHEEGIWKWLDGSLLLEGFWKEGEPNDIDDEDCAAVYPRENFFMAWNDVSCEATMKWVCEKALTS